MSVFYCSGLVHKMLYASCSIYNDANTSSSSPVMVVAAVEITRMLTGVHTVKMVSAVTAVGVSTPVLAMTRSVPVTFWRLACSANVVVTAVSAGILII